MPFTSHTSWEHSKKDLISLTSEGKTFREIGELYGVSKQRIKQVFQKLKIDHIGLKVKKKDNSIAYQKKWGNKVDTDLYRAQREKFHSKKARALSSGKSFTIEFGELEWPTHCPILGLELDYFVENGRQENSPSFDQIVPSLGYVAGNVQIISWRANRIKNDGTAEEHQKIAEYLTSQKAATLLSVKTST